VSSEEGEDIEAGWTGYMKEKIVKHDQQDVQLQRGEGTTMSPRYAMRSLGESEEAVFSSWSSGRRTEAEEDRRGRWRMEWEEEEEE
jgi:hypothetical protein